jgi:HTH-type transcriptional regulator/antitoxin HigA
VIDSITILAVRNVADLTEATAHLHALMDAPDADAHADEIAAQGQLIAAYEKIHFPIPTPDLMSAVRFRMDQMGYDRSDLAKVLGVERGRVSELMRGKRQFTVAMLRALHGEWGIPADALLNGPSRPRRKRRKASA